MSPRTGRPTDNPKMKRLEIRMSDDEYRILDYCCRILGWTKSDVLREGLRKVYIKAVEEEEKKNRSNP